MMNNQPLEFNSSRLLSVFSSILFGFLAVVSVWATSRNPSNDFDGDGKSDIAVFRPSNGYWYIAKSGGGYSFIKWGQRGDMVMPGDYDGDGKTDVAVWRQGITDFSIFNRWYILRSSDFTFSVFNFGLIEDRHFSMPVPPADYDGDGKTDLGTITQEYTISGTMSTTVRIYLEVSSPIGGRVLPNTFSGIVIPADYDGDGKADFASFLAGLWTIEQSSNGATRTVSFGLRDDALVPADYDGDGKVDIAVWRPSNGYWYWLSSRDGSFNSYKFGQPGDGAIPGDYDGDGKTDFAVFRLEGESQVRYIQQSRDGFRAVQFGLSDDVPISR